MDDPNWALLETCGSNLDAQVIASLLQSESVPVLLKNDGAVPGLEAGTQVCVPTHLAHRARWLLAQATLSETELDLLAAQHPAENP